MPEPLDCKSAGPACKVPALRQSSLSEAPAYHEKLPRANVDHRFVKGGLHICFRNIARVLTRPFENLLNLLPRGLTFRRRRSLLWRENHNGHLLVVGKLALDYTNSLFPSPDAHVLYFAYDHIRYGYTPKLRYVSRNIMKHQTPTFVLLTPILPSKLRSNC